MLCGVSPLREWAIRAVGDFTTLRLLAEEAAAAGAVTVGLNPLHALFPGDPERASPYHPSDRRFLDPLAIDAFNLPEPLLTQRRARGHRSRRSRKPRVLSAQAVR